MSERPEMREHRIRIRRTARYHTLGEVGEETGEIWFVCHGYGQLARRFLRRFQTLDDGSRLIVAPEALNRYYVGDPPGAHGPETLVGATWMTHEDRLNEIDDYVHYLDALYDQITEGVDMDRVVVHALGFSQGVATVTRWAALGSARIDRLTLWAAFPPPDLDLAVTAGRLRLPRLTLVAGQNDPYVGAMHLAAARERLTTHQIPHEVVIFDGGHEIDEETLVKLAGG